MRKLIAVVALSLSASAAWAQAEKATIVTKLPGEESLSLRERAERDFLMPVRRKKATAAAERTPETAPSEQTTASPEIDATAHYAEAAPDPRPEEAAATEAKAAVSHSRAARHAAWVAARREARAEEAAAERRAEARAEARRAARHSKTKRSTETTHHSKAKHHTTEKASSHRSSKTHTTKAAHHTTAKKEKTKTKTSAATHKKKHKR